MSSCMNKVSLFDIVFVSTSILHCLFCYGEESLRVYLLA